MKWNMKSRMATWVWSKHVTSMPGVQHALLQHWGRGLKAGGRTFFLYKYMYQGHYAKPKFVWKKKKNYMYVMSLAMDKRRQGCLYGGEYLLNASNLSDGLEWWI